MILAAQEEARATKIVGRLLEFRDQPAKQLHNVKIPTQMAAFFFPRLIEKGKLPVWFAQRSRILLPSLQSA